MNSVYRSRFRGLHHNRIWRLLAPDSGRPFDIRRLGPFRRGYFDDSGIRLAPPAPFPASDIESFSIPSLTGGGVITIQERASLAYLRQSYQEVPQEYEANPGCQASPAELQEYQRRSSRSTERQSSAAAKQAYCRASSGGRRTSTAGA